MKKTAPIETRDGSHTLFNEKAGEHYHSVFGAVQESEHIFIRAGLDACHPAPETLQVLEIGFGTGLNALLSMQWAEKHGQSIRYLGLEAFPLSQKQLEPLNYPDMLSTDKSLFMKMHDSPVVRQLSLHFALQVLHEKFQDFSADNSTFHVVFFDAFSPDSQPEMWTVEGFRKLYNALVPDGILVTYSCKGDVKRALKAAGFSLEKLPGPPGKREFLRAFAVKK